MKGRASLTPAGLYIHVPFCWAKCRYCDFNSQPLGRRSDLSRYCRALCRDIHLSAPAAQGRKLISVYFGGGTPSLLSPAEITRIISTVRAEYALAPDAEITLEANPGTVAASAWRGILAGGINRLSFGIQSFDNALLSFLGRIHTALQAESAVTAARRAGCANISADLIYGIPGETAAHWERDLDQLIRLNVDHVSVYDLTLEPGTVLWQHRHTLRLADADTMARRYRDACRVLTRAGYRQYEISSFARPGKESRHNQLYWRNQETFGCGAGAFSYVAGTRFSKCRDRYLYMRQAAQGALRRYGEETLPASARLRETLVLNIRRLNGITRRRLRDQTGLSIPADIEQILSALRAQGLMRRSPERIALTRKGILWYDSVAAELL